MIDPRFCRNAGPFSLGDILAHPDIAPLLDPGFAPSKAVKAFKVSEPAGLESAGPGSLSLFDNPRHLHSLKASKAGAILCRKESLNLIPKGALAIPVKHPYRAFCVALGLFCPEELWETPARPKGEKIAESASVDPEARLGADVEIGPYCHVSAGVEIGKGTRLAGHAYLGPGVVLGEDCDLGPNVSVVRSLLGNRVRLLAGARIGQRGFGFISDSEGCFPDIPHLGRVILGDDVEIGANSAVDRGTLEDTIIEEGTRIDNLVQIGHNCRIGRYCIIAGMAGIAGSTKIGNFVRIGGHSAIAQHLEIADRCLVSGLTGISKSIPTAQRVSGIPASEHRIWVKRLAALKKLARG